MLNSHSVAQMTNMWVVRKKKLVISQQITAGHCGVDRTWLCDYG